MKVVEDQRFVFADSSGKFFQFWETTVAHDIPGPLIYECASPCRASIAPQVVKIFLEQICLYRPKVHTQQFSQAGSWFSSHPFLIFEKEPSAIFQISWFSIVFQLFNLCPAYIVNGFLRFMTIWKRSRTCTALARRSAITEIYAFHISEQTNWIAWHRCSPIKSQKDSKVSFLWSFPIHNKRRQCRRHR